MIHTNVLYCPALNESRSDLVLIKGKDKRRIEAAEASISFNGTPHDEWTDIDWWIGAL